ncbi:hypothetical protein I4U23_004489 [Adineta vaga]|nr:hypothetical protein I4U23_004489 [Adineta vaga]
MSIIIDSARPVRLAVADDPSCNVAPVKCVRRTPKCVYRVAKCEEPVRVITIDACPIIKTCVVKPTRKVVYSSPFAIVIR